MMNLRDDGVTLTTMKPINKDELYEHLGGFLKSKGIELKDGSYAKRIQQGCSVLSDVINLGQSGIEKAKVGTEKKLDQLRQVIHEKTAPKTPAPAPQPATPPPAAKPAPCKAKSAPKTAATAAARKPAKK